MFFFCKVRFHLKLALFTNIAGRQADFFRLVLGRIVEISGPSQSDDGFLGALWTDIGGAKRLYKSKFRHKTMDSACLINNHKGTVKEMDNGFTICTTDPVDPIFYTYRIDNCNSTQINKGWLILLKLDIKYR